MLHLDADAGTPLYLQIYQQLKNDILSGAISEGTRLMSTRSLARELQAGRNTVENAYAQLALEGYITAVPASGFTVNPMQIDLNPAPPAGPPPPGKPRPAASAPFRYDFHYGNLDPATFPAGLWHKLAGNVLTEAAHGYPSPPDAHAYGDARGDLFLREEVAKYLYHSRGVNCSAEHILICSGLQPMLTTLIRLFPYESKRIALEEPGYTGHRVVFEANGVPIHPIPSREDGIDIAVLAASPARVVLVTPSHQFPTGAVMPIQKRMELLRWAADNENLIIEDDYDSEFRYNGRPVPSLQSIDKGLRTVYMGTFSKALSPGLRIGYLVLPEWLLASFMDVFGKYKCPVSLLDQKILARFMAEGHWEKHVRKMCIANKKKHDLLLAAVSRSFGNRVRVMGQNAGLHVLLEFADGRDEETLVALAAEQGVKVYPASVFHLRKNPEGRCRILIGYGQMPQKDITEGVAALARAWFA